MYVRLLWIAVAALLAAACVPATTEAPPSTAPGTAVVPASFGSLVPAGRWRAILIAGDNNSPAFDNGVQALRDRLSARGVNDFAIYSSDSARTAPAQLASSANVAAAIRTGGGEACFVFVTSHGEERGFVLRPDRRLFDPASLDRVLNAGCGGMPTVVVVSACHSGTFLTPAMRKPNRVILTAAATDRTSFGCGAGDQYTYYDQCLLQQFDGAATWRELGVATRACVEALERRMGVRPPSQPQMFVGAEVERLRLPSP